MLDDTIYIVVSIDKNFYHHLNVLINSIKFYNKSKIHLFLCISTFKDKEFFSSNLSTFNSLSFSFEIILFQKHDFLDIFAGKKYDHPIECYFRILFGSLLPQRIQKIIYLDADMIVNCDLFELYNTNIATTI
ncbi:hypothetical protein H6768_04215 [Candidatus Peribacteria bacterium]|nr:hypothetical protein [Candidatus Peribacteria bacterium]